jgi:hypothetical protein
MELLPGLQPEGTNQETEAEMAEVDAGTSDLIWEG